MHHHQGLGAASMGVALEIVKNVIKKPSVHGVIRKTWPNRSDSIGQIDTHPSSLFGKVTKLESMSLKGKASSRLPSRQEHQEFRKMRDLWLWDLQRSQVLHYHFQYVSQRLLHPVSSSSRKTLDTGKVQDMSCLQESHLPSMLYLWMPYQGGGSKMKRDWETLAWLRNPAALCPWLPCLA